MHNWQIAFRTLLRRPGFTVTAVLMLVLGISSTTALFSVVDTILLKPMPYPHAERLVWVLEANPLKSKRDSLIAPVRLQEWARMNQSFEIFSGSYNENFTDLSGQEPERLRGRQLAPGYMDVFGVAPILGRTFTKQEEVDGGPNAAIISYALWTRRYGQERNVISKSLRINGHLLPIIGVMPKEFLTPDIDVWVPAQFQAFWGNLREARFLSGVGRLKPGVTIAQAQADLSRVEAELAREFPKSDKDWSAIVGDLKEARVGEYRRTLLLVFGSVALLMLIAIANIAGLTLAQLHQREREMAIRSSVGASRAQVIATVMREVLLIAVGGAILGAAAGAAGVSAIGKIYADLPRMTELTFDWRALAFAAASSLIAALIFGAIPAFQSTRADLAPVLAESSRSVSGGRRVMQRGLVVAQLALTVLLLAGAGLLLRSYYNLTRVDSGFDTSNTITFHVGAGWSEDRPRIGRMQIDLISALERAPGIEAAGFTNFLPATGATLNFQSTFDGSEWNDKNFLTTGYRNVTAGYMQALHMQLISGKFCDAADAFDFSKPRPTQVMVNRRFVETYAKDGNVLGHHLHFTAIAAAPSAEIVGVVGDALEDGLSVSSAPYVYECQQPGSWPDPEYVVRARGSTAAIAGQIRAIVHQVAPGRAVFGMRPLDSVVEEALEQPRLNSRFLAGFAGAAMLLASVGLYSLISLIVAARTREIGVRIALGASAGQIMRLVFAGAGRMLAAGIALGVILTIAAARWIQSVLFGVAPIDVVTIGAAVVVLGVVAVIATFFPARRAASIDPLDAIRIE
jgi:putative ABC transport system permease protein